jgi:23S rRNA (adenine2503-C2)-methyltransferase
MEILKNYTVPTGNILIVQGDKGKLECLSLGDYGKDINLNQHKKVEHVNILPLEEKWVVTISTQYGCNSNCKFCDVPKVGKGINATYDDLLNQVLSGLSLHPEVTSTKRLNVHYARMGEPTWNQSVLHFTRNMRKELYPYINRSLIHPVISTMLPKKNKKLFTFLNEWMEIKNYDFRGDAGLQFSINSTDNQERNDMFSNNCLSIEEISKIGMDLDFPKGRKITLNFAVADYTIDAEKLRDLFSPKKFIVKLTPMHKTSEATKYGIKTNGNYTEPYPYIHHEEALKKVGFEVLTFIASREEDDGRITCGNAILSGTEPFDQN